MAFSGRAVLDKVTQTLCSLCFASVKLLQMYIAMRKKKRDRLQKCEVLNLALQNSVCVMLEFKDQARKYFLLKILDFFNTFPSSLRASSWQPALKCSLQSVLQQTGICSLPSIQNHHRANY